MKTDTQLQRDVIDELQFDPSIDASNIGVIAKQGGIVTLTGKVSSYADKYGASEAAERVLGVKAVSDELKVDLPLLHKRDDQEIAQAAVSALKWHVWIPQDAIKVRVEQGWVTLEGTVDYKFQQSAAEDAVQHLTGVIGVSNMINLKKSVVTPSELKVKIENALNRAAELDGQRINVEVEGNNVVLRGKVSSCAEREEAERAAWSAPGVWAVDDKLEIAA
jgi:osmotically-inducible protein OsmY